MDNSIENGGDDKSMLLTENVPKYGRVSMLFYIPDTVKDRDTFIELIKVNGGNIVTFHEAFTYQLGPPENTKDHDYYTGQIYSFQWIIDSIEHNSLQDKANYVLLNYQNGIDFPFQNKKKIQYTMREIITIYQWISGRKSQSSRKTWEGLCNDGLLFCRSKESLKNFWKKWSKYTLDECIDKMQEKDTRYCHNYVHVITPHEEITEDTGSKNKRKRMRDDSENANSGEQELI